MVDGVNGNLDCVVRLVVEGYRTILEFVTIPNLHVEGLSVKVLAVIPQSSRVMIFAVQVIQHHSDCCYLAITLS